MTFLWIGIVLAVIFIAVLLVENARLRRISPEEEEKMLKASTDHVVHLVEDLEIVRKLQYEKACKEELMTEIHDLFFFRELVYPKNVKKHLESKLNALKEQKYDVEEAKQKISMYEEILAGIKHHHLERLDIEK
mgnify:CR=1 FL=1